MRGRAWNLLRAVVAVSLFAAILYLGDMEKILSELRSVRPGLYLSAAALFLLTYIPSGLRWQKLSGSLGYEMGLRESMKLMAMAYSFNKLLPGNAGDLTRSKIAERYTPVEKHAEILGVVALERVLDLVTVLTIILVTATLIGARYLEFLAWLLVPAFAVVLLFVLTIRFRSELLLDYVSFIPGRVESFLMDVLNGYRAVGRDELLISAGYSGMKWGLEVLVFYLLAQSIGAPAGLLLAGLVTSTMSLVAAAPITPAGLGPVDAIATSLLAISGMSVSMSVSLVLLQRSIGFVLMGALGTFVYFFENAYSRSSS
ncbi:MAG: lysylphosphatidylglycerol synthase transmembrane domain-containing protein [Candidatus Nanohaloarchaea archaeon]